MSPWRKWATNSPQHRLSWTTVQNAALPMIISSSNVLKQWLCIVIGSMVKLNRVSTSFIGALARVIVQTILPSIILPSTTKGCTWNICKCTHPCLLPPPIPLVCWGCAHFPWLHWLAVRVCWVPLTRWMTIQHQLALAISQIISMQCAHNFCRSPFFITRFPSIMMPQPHIPKCFTRWIKSHIWHTICSSSWEWICKQCCWYKNNTHLDFL